MLFKDNFMQFGRISLKSGICFQLTIQELPPLNRPLGFKFLFKAYDKSFLSWFTFTLHSSLTLGFYSRHRLFAVPLLPCSFCFLIVPSVVLPLGFRGTSQTEIAPPLWLTWLHTRRHYFFQGCWNKLNLTNATIISIVRLLIHIFREVLAFNFLCFSIHGLSPRSQNAWRCFLAGVSPPPSTPCRMHFCVSAVISYCWSECLRAWNAECT